MKKNWGSYRMCGLLLCLLLALIAIGGCSSSGSSSTTGSSLSGKVADGYVSGATVKVYSDSAMTTEIGSGSTDTSGAFTISLTVSTVPSTIYIKTVGGTDISTGLAAPTMAFAGSYTAGSLNVTPVTNTAFIEYQKNPSSGLDAAYTTIAGKLGISTTDAKADVEANVTAQGAMYKVLSAGTTGTTLPDGDYEVKFISFLKSDIDSTAITGITIGANPLSSLVRTFNVTISSGGLSGTTSDTGEAITGRVQGTTIIMDMAKNNTLYRLAGEINYGAASGSYNKLSKDAGTMTNGVFLATFTPSTITAAQMTNLITSLASINTGLHYFAARDVLIKDGSPYTSYGKITLANLSTSGFDYSAFNVNANTDNNTETNIILNASGTASFFSQSRIYTFSQSITAFGQTIYSIGAAGNRKGIAVFVDNGTSKVRTITELNIVRNTDIAPQIQSDTLYKNYVAVAHMGLLNAARNTSDMVIDGGQIQTPVFSGGVNSGYAFSGGQNIIMAGSTLMVKQCADFTTFGPNDSVMALELYESGAMSGTRVQGGTGPGGVSIADYPSANVIFMRKDGTTPSDFSGTLNFISRTMYSTDYTYFSSDYAYGTITLNTTGTTATLAAKNGVGTAVNATLNLEKVLSGSTFTGLVHIYGSLGGSNGYIDIYWPVGGKRATYASSESATGNTFSVGESYLTF